MDNLEDFEKAPMYSMPRKPKFTKPYYVEKYAIDSDEFDKIEIFLKMNGSNGNFNLKNLNNFVDTFFTSEMQSNLDLGNLKELMQKSDTNNDGILSSEEFVIFYKNFFSKN